MWRTQKTYLPFLTPILPERDIYAIQRNRMETLDMWERTGVIKVGTLSLLETLSWRFACWLWMTDRLHCFDVAMLCFRVTVLLSLRWCA